MTLPGGVNLNRASFEADVQAVAVSMIQHARKVVVLPKETERGSRFNDDRAVLFRVESMFTETEFIHEPLFTVEAALVDAAKADYWYGHEKEYETQDDCCYGNCGDGYGNGDEGC